MECIIGGLVPDKLFHLVQLLSRMMELIFHHWSGWQQADLILFHNIVRRFLILLEEWIGEKQCVITSHNLIYIVDDIKRFGLPDNYWCWGFERCVKKYVDITSNQKAVELSFARTESRREAIKSSTIQKKQLKYRTNFEQVTLNFDYTRKVLFLYKWVW